MASLIPQLTYLGNDMMLEAMNGDGIIFTRIVVGDGPAPADPKAMTALGQLRKDIVITDFSRASNYAVLTGHYNNSDIESGFYMKELGIYAQNTAGEEFLYAYRYAATDVEYIPAITSGRIVETQMAIIVSIGSVEDVQAIIAEGTGYATEAALMNHVNDHNNPHRVTKSQLGLENVENVAPSNMTITFTDRNTLDNPASGDTMAVLMSKLSGAIKTLRNHLQDYNNPHRVTGEQTGGGGGSEITDGSDLTVSYQDRDTLDNITSGDTLKVIASKLNGAIKSLRSHIQNKQNPHEVTISQIGAAADDHTHTYSDVGAAAANHTHTLSSLGAAAANHTHTPASIGAATANHTHTPASIGAAAETHTHNASDINSGILNVARGGTGVDSYDALALAMAATVAETKTYLEID